MSHPDGAGVDWERLLAERGDQLMGTAIALAGSRDAGEDLLQAALERVLRKPRRLDGDIESYLRRVLCNLAADGWRRRGRWRQRLPLLRAAGTAATDDGTGAVDLRDALVRLVLQLPPRQRAVIVLRFYEDLSEAATAALLGCSTGTVKSQTVKALAKLRIDTTLVAESPAGGGAPATPGITARTAGMTAAAPAKTVVAPMTPVPRRQPS